MEKMRIPQSHNKKLPQKNKACLDGKYRGIELLNKKTIAGYIKKNRSFAPGNLLIFDQLSSTNTHLAELIKEKGAKKYACFAECQTAGRGRLGKTWVSPFAGNIYLSLSWPFAIKSGELSPLGLVIAVAIVEALKAYGIEQGLSLKWPNDVLWEGRKLAGVLIDLLPKIDNVCVSIIGVGLNIKMPKSAADKINQPWCDIAQITKDSPRRNKLAGLLIDKILQALTTYQRSGFESFINKWLLYDGALNKEIVVITGQQKISGIYLGIDDKGYMLLRNDNGQIQRFSSGEVSLRI
jgi:BirA family transcriptional regulator, biotin operon repressor / biotin---[acetyl-CoA-carboxylase] ligase